MSAQEKQDLQNHVDHIAETLRNGMTFEDAGIDHEENGSEPDDMISGFDWLQDALDMEFTISSDGRFHLHLPTLFQTSRNLLSSTRSSRLKF